MHSATILLSRRLMIACALMVGLAGGATHAAEVYLTKSMGLTTPPTSWETSGYWSDGLPAAAGNDYYIGRTGAARGIPSGLTAGTLGCRTPNNIDAIFPGDSLTVDTSGTLGFKGGATKNYTFNDLRLTGTGMLSNSSNNTTCVLLGLITISETPTIQAAASGDSRNFVINGQLAGSGVLKLMMDAGTGAAQRKTISFASDAITFSGDIIQSNGYVEIRNKKGINSVHNYSITSGGKMQSTVDVDGRNTTLSLASGTQVDLTHRMLFANVIVNGTKLAAGKYTSADLQASYSAYFTNAGGTLYVADFSAFDVVQIATMPAGAGNDWTKASYWSDNLAAHAGADYFVGRTRDGSLTPVGTVESICRTPEGGSEWTFPGDSLTIGSNAQLRIKAATGGAVINVADLKLTSGTIDDGTDNTSYTVRGHLLVQGNSRIRTYDNSNRQIIIESLMEGPASANLLMLANTIGNKSVMLSNNANTYAGSITCTTGTLILNARSALGKARLVTVGGVGKLQTIVPVTSAPNTTLTLTTGGKLDLANVVGFGKVVIGGKTLAQGKYKASALQTSYSAYIINNGGELQVGYDPSPVRGSWLFN